MKKNLSSQLIHWIIEPSLVPRKAGGNIGSSSISHNFFYIPSESVVEVLEAAFLMFVSWLVYAPKLCVVFSFFFVK